MLTDTQRISRLARPLFKCSGPPLTVLGSTGSRTNYRNSSDASSYHPKTRFMTQRAEHLVESDHPLLQVVQTTADAADPAAGDRLAAAPTVVRGTDDHLPPHHATTRHSVSRFSPCPVCLYLLATSSARPHVGIGTADLS